FGTDPRGFCPQDGDEIDIGGWYEHDCRIEPLLTEAEWWAKLPDGDLYQRCPDCDGRGSISIMDGQGRETEHQCERCYHSGGYVKVERGSE
ncbi:hypothetical protein LCGC14_2938300, partial [marine sediment metagenome]